MRSDLPMVRLQDENAEWGSGMQPGEFFWRDIKRGIDGPSQRHLAMTLPDGAFVMIPVHRHDEVPVFPTSWAWDGDEDRPTLTPSVFVNPRGTPPGWHGYVTAGVMRGC